MAGFDFGAPRIKTLGRSLAPKTRVDPRINNGTIGGGLAFALQNYLAGSEDNAERKRAADDEAAYNAAQEALARGLVDQPALDAPLPEGVSGPVRPALPGGLGAAAKELAGLEGNPYAGRLATQLAMMQADQRREDQRYNLSRSDKLADRDADRAFQREMLAARMQAQAASRQPTAAPSSVREYQYYNSLPPDQQRQYLMMKRANPYLNLGDVYAQPDPTQPGQVMGQIGVGVAPDTTIDTKGGRVITTPGVPGSPRGGVPGQMPQQGMAPQPQQGGQWDFAPGQQPGGVGITELPMSPEQARKQAETDRMRGVQANVVNNTIDLARDLTGDDQWTTGISGSALSYVPGTDAHTLSQRLDTIRANIGFDKLQAMRDASPTGGALGQVSEMENRLLQAVYGSLNQAQNSQELGRVLDQVQNTYNEIIHRGIPPEEAQRRLQQIEGGGASTPSGGFSIRRID